ncbi:MAG: beta-glucuronidase [Clostridia bacterium]|nr:beta-glucuronidase [Clostridia bacterium]
MNRLFKRSNYAKYFLLDKMWDFAVDPEECGIQQKWYENFPQNSEKIPVPSCWNMTLGKFRYTGTAWYKTEFEISSDSAYIKFEGVANECDVYVDGVLLGSHYGAFVEFGFAAHDIGSGTHELVVRVNNTLNFENTTPHPKTDWFNYGGINRSVEIREIGDVWLSDYRIDYKLDVGAKCAVLDISADIVTRHSTPGDFEIYINDSRVYASRHEINSSQRLGAWGIRLDNIELWDVYQPNLYYVRIKFANEDIIDRIGFREIAACGKDIMLNGKKLTITGINRHEEHPDWGFAMPFALIKRDIDIIRDMNCNAIRGSHYPNSKMTLDYCDEVGMLFWEEIPVWGYRADIGCAAQLSDDTFVSRILSMHTEMVKRDVHHPSIIMWGFHNEISNELDSAVELSRSISKTIKSIDASRLLTYASNNCGYPDKMDRGFDTVDVISHNYYPGWYSSTKNEGFEEFVSRVRSELAGTPNEHKPMLVSEFGAGAIKGSTAFEAPRWTENYQAAMLDDAITAFMDSGEIAGTYIWQYCDMRSEMDLSRIRGFNNKGILDEFRRPKFAYETVKRVYGKYNPDCCNKTGIEIY